MTARNKGYFNLRTTPHRPARFGKLTRGFSSALWRSAVCAGIAAASRIKKSCLVLCTNSVSVDQWKYQFQLWSSLDSRDISRFTSQQKEAFTGVANVCITTYTMIAYSGRRSEESAKVRWIRVMPIRPYTLLRCQHAPPQCQIMLFNPGQRSRSLSKIE